MLGEGEAKDVHAQISVGFREHLHELKGARLHVFLAIALHTNADGWAWPSYALLRRETGYGKDTIARALADLCELTIEGHRVLLRFQPYDHEAKRLMSNRYLIFPSEKEVKRYEVDQCRHFLDTGNQDTRKQSPGKQYTGNADTKKNHTKVETEKAETEKGEPVASAAAGSEKTEERPVCSIHNVPMERREKDGDVWYSHRLSEGSWCKGGGNQDVARRSRERDRRRYLEWARGGQ